MFRFRLKHRLRQRRRGFEPRRRLFIVKYHHYSLFVFQISAQLR